MRLLLISFALFLAGCGTASPRTDIVTAGTWTIGEAKSCTLDGKWNEMHCFPPALSSDPDFKDFHHYLVDAKFESPVRFDDQKWAYDIVCRLESDQRATCIQQQAR